MHFLQHFYAFAKDLQKLLISHFAKVEKFGQNSSGEQKLSWWCCKGSSIQGGAGAHGGRGEALQGDGV